ncbi:MAG TPA: TraB/VirB10 family protein [Chlamydiales bacterium]|nr:TraB/VirB10 family protein [Chlamydiales bacterium]
MKKFSSAKIRAKQKKFFLFILAGCVGLALALFSFTSDEKQDQRKNVEESSFNVVSQEIDPKTIRISALEHLNDALNSRIDALEQSLVDLQDETSIAETDQQDIKDATHILLEKIKELEQEVHKPVLPTEMKKGAPKRTLQAWEGMEKKDAKHVSFEIPAGTVVKAVLVSGADCSVAVQKPTGPNMVLLRPLDHGHLPKNVRVPLKGSIIIGNAIGDLSSERVYIRAERMTLVECGGSFRETELSAYISGEDGREGMRGVVVDRSGQIVARAAFAAFLQGTGSGIEAAFNAKAFENLTEQHPNLSMLRYGPMQGSTTALNKMTDYYIKRAEQLQPAIQIAAGRIVDIVFTKTVKIGEKNLKKKFEMERTAKRSLHE